MSGKEWEMISKKQQKRLVSWWSPVFPFIECTVMLSPVTVWWTFPHQCSLLAWIWLGCDSNHNKANKSGRSMSNLFRFVRSYGQLEVAETDLCGTFEFRVNLLMKTIPLTTVWLSVARNLSMLALILLSSKSPWPFLFDSFWFFLIIGEFPPIIAKLKASDGRLDP